MLNQLVENFKKDGENEIEILLNEKDKKELENIFLSKLKGEMKKGVELKVSPQIENGFRIGKKGDNSYYDFTDEAIAEVFKAFLNPKITEIMESGEQDAR